MTDDVARFFAPSPAAIPLYAAIEAAVLRAWPDTRVDVQKTQIAFRARRGYACVWLPIRRVRGRPDVHVVLSFFTAYRVADPRIVEAVEARPHRWTHHVIVSRAEDVDEQLLRWIGEARAFSMR